MPRKSDHSSAETKEAIKNTFMELYRTKAVERITIGELVDAAHINRSTFYYYFEDIYDLLSQVERDFVTLIQEMFPHIISGILNRDFDDHLTVLMDFYKKNKKDYLLFLVDKPNQKVIQAVKQCAQEYALGIVGLSPKHLTLKQKLIIEYIANAQMGLISWWFQYGQECSIEELGQLITQINMEGPFPTLFQTLQAVESQN